MPETAMFKRILIPFDGSAASDRAAQIALEIAEAIGSQTIFAYAAPEFTGEEHAKRTLEPAVMLAKKAGVKFETHVIDGYSRRTADAIAIEAKNNAIDLIVIGTHGREGLEHLLLGSVAEGVSRKAQVPVMLVRAVKDSARYATRIGRILVAVDGSDPSRLGLETAARLGRALNASLEVLNVIPDVPISSGIGYPGIEYVPVMDYDRLATDLAAQSQAIVSAALEMLENTSEKPTQVHASSRTASGKRIADVIVESSADLHADLIVMGTHGLSGFGTLLLGSVAEAVSHHANIPVLLMRPQPIKKE